MPFFPLAQVRMMLQREVKVQLHHPPVDKVSDSAYDKRMESGREGSRQEGCRRAAAPEPACCPGRCLARADFNSIGLACESEPDCRSKAAWQGDRARPTGQIRLEQPLLYGCAFLPSGTGEMRLGTYRSASDPYRPIATRPSDNQRWP